MNGGGKEQFEVKPGPVPGRVAFDRVQTDPTFGAPFSVDISDDTERLDLNAAGDIDIINAAEGSTRSPSRSTSTAVTATT